MKLLFIGQAPSKETEGKPPFVGRAGALLASLMDTTQEKMLEENDFINVLNFWPGKGIGGDKFPMDQATEAAKKIVPQLRGRIVILLGSNVARAFGVKSFKYAEYYEIRNPDRPSEILVPTIAVIPHPSGVNRYYNNPNNRFFIAGFLKGAAIMLREQNAKKPQ